MFILRAFARRAGLGLAPGEHAPAVILPVQAVPGGQLGAALEAVFLFESEGSQRTPYSAANASPSSPSQTAFLCGLMDSVVVK